MTASIPREKLAFVILVTTPFASLMHKSTILPQRPTLLRSVANCMEAVMSEVEATSRVGHHQDVTEGNGEGGHVEEGADCSG